MASGQWRRLPPNSASFRWVFAVPGARVRTARQPRSSHRVVTPGHVLAWAHGIGLSGREPSSATVGARIACLSSYYRFLIRMQVAAGNPYDALERPKGVQSAARGLGADEVRRLLAVIPDTVAGRRDRALVLAFVLTGPGVVSFLDAVSRKTPLSPSGRPTCIFASTTGRPSGSANTTNLPQVASCAGQRMVSPRPAASASQASGSETANRSAAAPASEPLGKIPRSS